MMRLCILALFSTGCAHLIQNKQLRKISLINFDDDEFSHCHSSPIIHRQISKHNYMRKLWGGSPGACPPIIKKRLSVIATPFPSNIMVSSGIFDNSTPCLKDQYAQD